VSAEDGTAAQGENAVPDTPQWVLGDGLEPGDAYQEGPFVVFTAQFHLRRGYCCNSGCRHCPYR
jgi:hypothetical protein